MTNNERNRRLKTVSVWQFNQIFKLRKEGCSKARIKAETGATVKQINAVASWFEKYIDGGFSNII